MSSVAPYPIPSYYQPPYPWDFRLQIQSNCDQSCTNTYGGFTCSCVNGFRLASDGKTCLGENKFTWTRSKRLLLGSSSYNAFKASIRHFYMQLCVILMYFPDYYISFESYKKGKYINTSKLKKEWKKRVWLLNSRHFRFLYVSRIQN